MNTSASSAAFLRVEDIHKRFGAFEALRGVSLSVGEGQAMALIGPSGSGKSTVLRCINALETIDSGAIFVGGERIGSRLDGGRVVPLSAAAAARQREDIGMVFQSFNLFPHLDALGNVASGLLLVKRMKKREAHERAVALLERVGLASKSGSFPRQLSGGQQQRVAIARALAMEPRLMLFDEPTSALDPETVQEVLNVIREVRETRMTMLIATHEMEFARRVSDVGVFMETGQVVEHGPSEQVFLAPRTERCRRFLAGLAHSDDLRKAQTAA